MCTVPAPAVLLQLTLSRVGGLVGGAQRGKWVVEVEGGVGPPPPPPCVAILGAAAAPTVPLPAAAAPAAVTAAAPAAPAALAVAAAATRPGGGQAPAGEVQMWKVYAMLCAQQVPLLASQLLC